MGKLARMLLPTKVVLGVALATSANAEEIENYCLSRDAFQAPDELRIGNCTRFSNEIYTTFCREISANGKSVGWFLQLIQVGGRTIGFQCREDHPDYIMFEKETMRRVDWPAGAADDYFSEIVRPGNEGDEWAVMEFPVPGLGYYSSLEHCGSMIAYWRLVEADLSAVIFNVEQRSIIRSRSIGPALMETDSPGALPPPEWGARCRSVRFRLERWISEPVDLTLTIPD